MRTVIAACVLLFAAPSFAAPLRIVATGDSLTMGYAPYLPAAFTSEGISATPFTVAAGGMRAINYVGELALPNTSLTDYAALTLSKDPDVILFMLGTNDSFFNSIAAENWANYQRCIGGVFDRFAAAVNGRGRHPVVIVSTVLPFDMAMSQASLGLTSQSGAVDRIANWFNPWLREEAPDHGFSLLDNWELIQDQPQWDPRLLANDGLHLSPDGWRWLAGSFADRTADVLAAPEPTTLTIWLGLGAMGLMLARKRRGR